MTASGYGAYGQTHRQSLKGRALEVEAFVKAVQFLERAKLNATNSHDLRDALDYTRKLWMIVEADLSEVPHPLDDKTRSDLLALGQFVTAKCLEIAQSNDRAALNVLIEINQDIARGLMGRD